MQCNKCKGKFEPPENMVLTACPFCQTKISSEEKMLALIAEHSTEIYNQPHKFAEALGEYFKDDPLCEILQALAINETSVYLYNLKGTTPDYIKTLQEVMSKTIILKETLAPAFELLFMAFGFELLVIQNNALVRYKSWGSIINITIPDCVNYIDHAAFEDCKNLTEITLNSNNITLIGGEYIEDIYDCYYDSNREINRHIYTSYEIGTIVVSDDYYSDDSGIYEKFHTQSWFYHISPFSNLSNLTKIDLSNMTSLSTIGKHAFLNSKSITEIILPDSVEYILNGAFEGCTSLTKIVIPNSVNCIGDTVEEEIVFSEDDGQFWCNSTYEDYLNNNSIFGEPCYKSFVVDTINVGGVFEGCTSLTSITIPDSVTSIGENAFKGCTSLIKPNIPDSVTSIGANAFVGCRPEVTDAFFVGDLFDDDDDEYLPF